MKVFREGDLEFSFDDTWEADRWDGRPDHIRAQKAFGARAVDFVGLREANSVYLLEIKDYRKSPRQKKQPLGEEITRKVGDTVVGIVGACRRESTNGLWCRIAAMLADRNKYLSVVLWLEQGPFGARLGGRIGPVALADDLKRRCRLLGITRAFLLSRDAGSLPGLDVKGVASGT